ncbi:MAG: hypothetical protein GY851_25545, partial [bacterium]|nr:hypothetical protein [bacterium]
MQVSRQLVTGSLGAVLFLCGAQSWATEVYRDNVVIVLDASGSMGTPMSSTGGAKMDAAKMA